MNKITLTFLFMLEAVAAGASYPNYWSWFDFDPNKGAIFPWWVFGLAAFAFLFLLIKDWLKENGK